MAKKKTVEKETLSEAVERLNKTYGKGTIISLGGNHTQKYDTISTGSIGFDYRVLGVGGVIKGKLYEIRGWEGVGKSTFVATVAANCQKDGGKVVYIDGEYAVDEDYFNSLGVNMEDLLLIQPSYGEEGFELAEDLIKTGEVDLVIIDSDSSLIPKSAIENPMGASNIGKKAFLNSTAYPKLKIALQRNKCCVLIISQYREKIGVMFGDPKVTQGGHCLKYTADTIIELSKKLVKDGEETLANDVKIKTIKNKSFPPFRHTRVNIVFGEGIDKIGELIELSIEYNIISKSGSWYSYQGDKLVQGEDSLRDFFNDNPEFYENIKGKVIEAIKSGKTKEEPSMEEKV